jgi:hypothetical protein
MDLELGTKVAIVTAPAAESVVRSRNGWRVKECGYYSPPGPRTRHAMIRPELVVKIHANWSGFQRMNG